MTDQEVLRRAARIIEVRSNPKGYAGRVLLSTILRLLRDTADKIEGETSDMYR